MKFVNVHAAVTQFSSLNPLIPMNDQDRISPYNIKRVSSRQLSNESKEKISITGLLVNPLPNAPN